jgi:hypothetical protein
MNLQRAEALFGAMVAMCLWLPPNRRVDLVGGGAMASVLRLIGPPVRIEQPDHSSGAASQCRRPSPQNLTNEYGKSR